MQITGRWICRVASLVMIAVLATAPGVVPLQADDPEAAALESLSLESDRGALPGRPGQHLRLRWEIAADRLQRHVQLTWGPAGTTATLLLSSSHEASFEEINVTRGLAVVRAEVTPEPGRLRIAVDLASPVGCSVASLVALDASRKPDQETLVAAWNHWAIAAGKDSDQRRREVRRLRRAGSKAVRSLKVGLVCLAQLVELQPDARAALGTDSLVAAAAAIELEVPRRGLKRHAPVNHEALRALLEARLRCVSINAVAPRGESGQTSDPNGCWLFPTSIPVAFGEAASAGELRLRGQIGGGNDLADWYWLPYASAAECSPVASLPTGQAAVTVTSPATPLPLPGAVLVEAVTVKGRQQGIYLRVSRMTPAPDASAPLVYTVVISTGDAAGYTVFLEPVGVPVPTFPF